MQITSLRPTRPPHRAQPPLRIAQSPEISVIVPALNEAKNLPTLLERIDRALKGRSYEVIVVDDDSADGTPAACEALARRYPLRLVVRERAANGLSGAVLHGMGISHGVNLVVMDADLQHPPEKIPELLAKIESGEADFALGSRYVHGATTEEDWGWFRRLNSTVATQLSRPFAGRTRDPMSGFFALSRQMFEQAARLTPLGYKIALELMCKCRVKHIAEVPIHFGQRVAGESKLSLKQQARYLRHLARLYAFTFPRATFFAKGCSGALAGWTFGHATNPSLAGALATLAAAAFIAIKRPGETPAGGRELLSSERVFHSDASAIREAA
jgi:dolichol-phosphate mannosyltransferase